MAEEAKKRIVILGGGHGTSVVLKSLKEHDFDLSAVVSMADDGGSTGRLREQLGVLPPGDIRQCLVAASSNPTMQEFFSYRFGSGELKGHSFGNLFLSAAEDMTGSLEKGIELASRVLGCSARVIPVTEDKVRLVLAQNNEIIKGEDTILVSKIDQPEPNLYLEPAADISDSAKEVIKKADLVIIAPGNFYCSIIPTLIVGGMAEALRETKAKVVYICNLINIPNHTDGFDVADYLAEITRLSHGPVVDYAVFNTAEIEADYLRDNEKAVIVDEDKLKKGGYEFVGIDIAGTEKAQSNPNDEIADTRSLLAHDKGKLGQAIAKIADDL